MQNRRWRIQRACTNASTHSCGERSRRGKNYQIPDNNLVSLTKTWWDDSCLQHQPKRCSFLHTTRVKHGATYQKQHMDCLLEHRALSCGHAGLTLKVTELSSGRWEKETYLREMFRHDQFGVLMLKGLWRESPSFGKTAWRIHVFFLNSNTLVFFVYVQDKNIHCEVNMNIQRIPISPYNKTNFKQELMQCPVNELFFWCSKVS